MTQPEPPESPLWWVKRLHKQLRTQAQHFELMDAYYRGEPASLPWLPEQARTEFARLLKLTKSNYMGLVIDSMVERMQVEGFRVGASAQADKKTWKIWQANNLDSGFDQVLLESAIGGNAFLLIAPNATTPDRPLIYPEHPTQAIVAYEPGTSRRVRAAGLKVWRDDWTGHTMATLYLPDRIYKYRSERAALAGEAYEPDWQAREVRGEPWPAPNPLGDVPLVEIVNNPRMLSGGVSEIADVVSIQDRIGKTIADRLMTQDYGAFPQKWATGFPEADENGNANRIDVGRNRLVRSDIAETKFGQWDAAPLDPYSAAKREDVKDIASRTRTPAQYLLGEMSNVNGETLKASESGLVSKVRQRFRTAGEGTEDAARLARRIAGLGGDDEAMETIWRNPEFRTEGELVDALVKMATLGVPQEALWERWGASQVEIGRWKAMREEQIQLDPIGAVSRVAGQQDEGQPGAQE
ncbi:phage portal protein [Actinoplanes sp. N902-109]|uniref:phage portal protein n=1 Tax=Actinoplanes sp. (strain N902-109) TaxID=649831 RepID=UPI0003293FE9|nr:phage portal protein [Actinoplanes sp. N902-109]AGL13868.1 gp23 [Actinoplanes sp. N902-109]